MVKEKKIVKCEGRFNQLRDFLYNSAFPLILEDRTIINRDDLKNIWELSQEDIVTGGYDFSDPYYFNVKTDLLREPPNLDYLSLVPLVESHLHLEKGLIYDYLLSMGNSEEIAEKLEKMGEHPEKYLRSVLEKEPKEIILQNNKNLSGYRIAGNFGVGTLCHGGVKGGGVRSDSPFLLEVYKESENRGEYNLAAVIGFWAQRNKMLISQIQSCRNAKFPDDVQFGVAALQVGENVARKAGFEEVLVYSARQHPIFKQHPDSWNQMGKDFVCIWDNSAKKLMYDGSRNFHYYKNLKSHY